MANEKFNLSIYTDVPPPYEEKHDFIRLPSFDEYEPSIKTHQNYIDDVNKSFAIPNDMIGHREGNKGAGSMEERQTRQGLELLRTGMNKSTRRELIKLMYDERSTVCATRMRSFAIGKIREITEWVEEQINRKSFLYFLSRGTIAEPWGFITARGVFLYRTETNPTFKVTLAPLYIFNRQLTDSDLIMLDQLFEDPTINSPYYRSCIKKYITSSIINRMLYTFGDGLWANGPFFQEASSKFETIIRLIPGGYLNGPWKQLDGFFGIYYNSTTNTISDIPPKME